MTPEEAVDRLLAKGVITKHLWRGAPRFVLDVIYEVLTDETKRCAKLVGGGYLGNAILTTGGLGAEVERGHPNT